MVIPNMNVVAADCKKALDICKKHPGCKECPMINGNPLIIDEPIMNNDNRSIICETGRNKIQRD